MLIKHTKSGKNEQMLSRRVRGDDDKAKALLTGQLMGTGMGTQTGE